MRHFDSFFLFSAEVTLISVMVLILFAKYEGVFQNTFKNPQFYVQMFTEHAYTFSGFVSSSFGKLG